jgi:hypothetical protein
MERWSGDQMKGASTSYGRRVRWTDTVDGLLGHSGSDEPFEKETFYTKVGDQICGVGYYKK